MKFGLFVFLVSVSAWGSVLGNDSGNGGDAIVCDNGEAELFDYYEGRVLRNLIPSFGGPEFPLEQKIEMFLTRIELYDEKRAERYRTRLRQMQEERQWVNEPLVDIPDMGSTPIASSCRIAQAAIRQKPVFPEDKMYIFHRPTWNLLDDDSKAGLILHEAVYAEAKDVNSHVNSKNVRYFNSWIASHKGATMTEEEYKNLIQLTVLTNHSTEVRIIEQTPYGPFPYTLRYFAEDVSLDEAKKRCWAQTAVFNLEYPGSALRNSEIAKGIKDQQKMWWSTAWEHYRLFETATGQLSAEAFIATPETKAHFFCALHGS